jgi:hypothetical protein
MNTLTDALEVEGIEMLVLVFLNSGSLSMAAATLLSASRL